MVFRPDEVHVRHNPCSSKDVVKQPDMPDFPDLPKKYQIDLIFFGQGRMKLASSTFIRRQFHPPHCLSLSLDENDFDHCQSAPTGLFSLSLSGVLVSMVAVAVLL